MKPKEFVYKTDGPFCLDVCTCKTKSVQDYTKIGSAMCGMCEHKISNNETTNTIVCAKLRYRSKQTGLPVFLKN